MNAIVEGFVGHVFIDYDRTRGRFASCEAHSSEMKLRIIVFHSITEHSNIYRYFGTLDHANLLAFSENQFCLFSQGNASAVTFFRWF